MFKAKLMSQLIDKFINISKYFANWLIVKVVLKKKKQSFSGSSLSNLRISRFSLFYRTVNRILFDVDCLLDKKFEDPRLCVWKQRWPFFIFTIF